MTLRELARRLHLALEGDGDVEVTRVAALDQAGPGDLTFLANPRYAPLVAQTAATAVILGPGAPAAPCAVLRTANPYLAFARALALLHAGEPAAAGVHPTAWIAPGAQVAADACIGAFASIGPGVTIGARTVVHPHVTVGAGATVGDDCVVHSQASIREHVTLGHRVVVQNGAVIGSDGFGFAQRPDGTHEKIPQVGRVVVEDDVEIGANSTVDRPPVGETRIAAGTKLDNLVQVAHGVHIGRDVLLAAQVGIAGSTVIEDGVQLGGQVGVSGHITIGKGARATAQSGIPNSVAPGTLVSGYPAIENREWLKASTVFKKLPELRRIVMQLERRVAELEAHAAEHAAGHAAAGVAPKS